MLRAVGNTRWWILEITDYTDLQLDTDVPFVWLTIFKHKHRELPRPPKGSAWETTNKSQSQLSHGKRLLLVAGLKGKETKKWIFIIKEVNQSKGGKKERVQDEKQRSIFVETGCQKNWNALSSWLHTPWRPASFLVQLVSSVPHAVHHSWRC